MGGKCTVSCEKTGYSATIDFLTKPFYGGKKHQVKGQVFEPGNSKPTCVVNGEWNGVMWADYSSGVSVRCSISLYPYVQPGNIDIRVATRLSCNSTNFIHMNLFLYGKLGEL